ncbi:MAG: hypothetical protein HYY93_06970, partial [Planctomycetes bacterium]|nr:hypothetical protein [Planctomycetota bacterium]
QKKRQKKKQRKKQKKKQRKKQKKRQKKKQRKKQKKKQRKKQKKKQRKKQKKRDTSRAEAGYRRSGRGLSPTDASESGNKFPHSRVGGGQVTRDTRPFSDAASLDCRISGPALY